MRTNRRLIQNTRMCLEDIHQGKVKNKQQALAYIYMILQPYASLDHLSTAVLSHREKEELYDMAACIPRAFEILATTMETGDKRLNDLQVCSLIFSLVHYKFYLKYLVLC